MHEFVAQRLGGRERRGAVGIADDLHEAFAVAQVDEDDAAVVAAAMDPARQRDGLCPGSGGRCGRSSRCVSRYSPKCVASGCDGRHRWRRGQPARSARRATRAARVVAARSISGAGRGGFARRGGGAGGSAATAAAAVRARRHDAHRDDVLERFVDRHVELAHARARHASRSSPTSDSASSARRR